MRDLKLVVLVLLAAATLAACGSPAPNSTMVNVALEPNNAVANASRPANTNAAVPNTSAAVDGKQIYTENCQICHRNTAKGGPVTVEGKKLKPADLTTGHSKKHSDEDLIKDIQEGSPDDGMPAFKQKLKPEAIRAIVGYIRTLQT
ncbi:MAG: cytochrome c [Acidobacteria bacterium]|nr:cytochrome c [Acidobacteriota bacterium]